MSKARILVIGSTNTDMVIETSTLPSAGQTVLGGIFRMTPGGKGANQAMAAARAGADVVFLSAVGDDALGQESRERLAAAGIETRYIVTKADEQSGVALIMLDEQGENLIAVAPGANGRLEIADLVRAAPAFLETRLLIMQLEIPVGTVEWAAAYAQKLGCPVMLNPAPMPADGLSDKLLSCVDILTPNEGELRILAPDAATLPDAAASVLARGPKLLVVTQGRQGATVFSTEEPFHLPAFPVQAIDTVGAGDCFSAALGVAWAEGQSLPLAMRFAAAAAALSTTVAGAQQAMPEREIIERFLADA